MHGGNVFKILVGKHKGRDPFEDQGIDGRIILRGKLEIKGVRVLTGFNILRIGICGGLELFQGRFCTM
jgi:hypothetical protein